MIDPAPGETGRARRAAAQARRREVERSLAEAGLIEGPRGLAGETVPPPFDGCSGRRLRCALEALGPVFAAFGGYLGSRPDLLPLADCLELRQTEERGEPMAPAEVHVLIERELGRPFDETFAGIEAMPLRADLVTQTHRARLRGGLDALIRLVRPDTGAWLERDLPHLPLLAEVLRPAGSAFPLDLALAGFRQAILERAGLQEQAGVLRTFAVEAARLGSLRLPRVLLSTPGLLGLELLEGEGFGDRPSELDDAARRLCLAWLYHALRGNAFPVELAARDLRILADGTLGLQEGTFAKLPAPDRQGLHEYLEATAAEDPDKACLLLLREMEPGPAGAETELRQRFRQSVAFRDGGWGSARDGQSLAEQLFMQWRQAEDLGLRPLPHLVPFLRGLFGLAATVRSLTPPDSDPLRGALANLRLLAAADQLGRMADPDHLGRSLGSYAAAFADLPVLLDDALRRVADGRARPGFDPHFDAENRVEPRGASPALPISLALALAAVALVTARLGTLEPGGPWIEAAGAALFTVLGGLLLWSLEARR